MSERERADRAFKQYLEKRSVLSRAYHETSPEQPSPELDAAILTEARRAVRPGPSVIRSPFARSWIVPASLAAILLLTVGLVRFTFKETDEPGLPRTVPEVMPESTFEEMRQQKSEDMLEPADKPLDRQASLKRGRSATRPPAPLAQDAATMKSEAVTAEPRAPAARPPTRESMTSGLRSAPAEGEAAPATPLQARLRTKSEEQSAERDDARAGTKQRRANEPTAGLAGAIETRELSSKEAARIGADDSESPNRPEVTIASGAPALRLPDSLTTLIARTFPRFRVPDHRDLEAEWTYDPDTYPPFAAWSDFNGDGLIDVALILISENAFKQVIFNKTADGYIPAFEVGKTFDPPGGELSRPQRLYLAVVPKGQELTFPGTDQGQIVRFLPEHDSVESGVFGKEPALIFWQDGSYEMQATGGL